MTFVRWLDAHRRSLVFVFALLALGGIGSVWSLPLGLFPRTSFPRVVVSVDAGDRPADRMVVEVTRPLEEEIRSVVGVRDVRSNSSRGSCDISVNFDWGTDMLSRTLMVQAAISRVVPSLPAGTAYRVRRMDPTVFPVLGLSMRSQGRSLVELRDRAKFDLGPRLSTTHGVATIAVLGGRTEELQVLVDPQRLNAADVTLEDVVRAVSAANVVEAIGRLEQSEKLYLLLSDTQFKSLDALGKVIVQKSDRGIVTLDDVATIRDAMSPEWTRVVAGGNDAVVLNVYQQPDGNTVQISRDLQLKIADYLRHAPSDIQVATWYDQSEIVSNAIDSVREAALIGVALAIVVLWLFLKSFRVTLVAAVSVPVVLSITLLVLRLAGQSLDIMTLGGMAAAVGLILDDGIVMVEHAIRRLRESGSGERLVVLGAGREMMSSLTGSSLATVVVFVPLAFLQGVTGAFFKALALTMASALVVSFAFSALAVPVIADWLLGAQSAAEDDIPTWLKRVQNAYSRVLARMLERPVWLLAGVVPLLVLGYLAYQRVGSGFLPAMDEGGFVLDYRSPSSTSLAETDRRLREIEKILATTPEVASYSRRTGLILSGGVAEANEGDYFVRLKPPPRRSLDDVMDEVRERGSQEVPGLELEFAKLMEDLIGDLTAVPQPIEVKLFGPEPDVLRTQAAQLAHKLASLAGVVDVKSGVILAGDAVDIRVDRLKADLLGLDPDQVTRLARIVLQGEVTTQVQRGEKMVGIRVWSEPEVRKRLELIRQLPLLTKDGTRVRLGRVATLDIEVGQPQIVRENLKTMVAVTGRISGRDLGSVMRDVQKTVGAVSLPSGMYAEYGGLYRIQQDSFQGLVLVMIAAAMLVFALLLYLYESLAAPVAILLVALLAAVAVFPALWLTDIELNITSMVGLTMIVGISSEASIFYMSQFHELSRDIDARAALVQAGVLRFRPIAMTALAAILALLPLALGIGQGSAMLQPLAIAIVAGLTLTVPAVLLLLPVLLRLLSAARFRAQPEVPRLEG